MDSPQTLKWRALPAATAIVMLVSTALFVAVAGASSGASASSAFRADPDWRSDPAWWGTVGAQRLVQFEHQELRDGPAIAAVPPTSQVPPGLSAANDVRQDQGQTGPAIAAAASASQYPSNSAVRLHQGQIGPAIAAASSTQQYASNADVQAHQQGSPVYLPNEVTAAAAVSSPSSTGQWIAIGAGVAAGIVIALAIWMLARRRRRPGEPAFATIGAAGAEASQSSSAESPEDSQRKAA